MIQYFSMLVLKALKMFLDAVFNTKFCATLSVVVCLLQHQVAALHNHYYRDFLCMFGSQNSAATQTVALGL